MLTGEKKELETEIKRRAGYYTLLKNLNPLPLDR